MSDLISRQAAIDVLEKVAELYPWRVPGDRDSYSQYNEAWQDALNRADSEIEALPSAQPEPKAGHWIHKHERTTNTWECSNCGYRVNLMDGGIYKFCSACCEKKEGEE